MTCRMAAVTTGMVRLSSRNSGVRSSVSVAMIAPAAMTTQDEKKKLGIMSDEKKKSAVPSQVFLNSGLFNRSAA
jgi:hypothetical protein